MIETKQLVKKKTKEEINKSCPDAVRDHTFLKKVDGQCCPDVPGARADITDNVSLWIDGKKGLAIHLDWKDKGFFGEISALKSEFRRITEKIRRGKPYYYRWDCVKGKYEYLGNKSAYKKEALRVKNKVANLREKCRRFHKRVAACVLGSVKKHLVVRTDIIKVAGLEYYDFVKLSRVLGVVEKSCPLQVRARSSRTDNKKGVG